MGARELITAVLLIGSFTGTCAVNDNYPAGARAAGMGHIGVASSDFWSIWQNQAGLGFYSHAAVGIHHETRFAVSEFSLHAMGFTLPTSTGTFGFSWSRFGYRRYHEDKFGVALGKQFHERFAAGLQLNYLNHFIDDEIGRSGTAAIEAGILAQPLDGLFIGFHVFNPSAARLDKRNKERIPVIMRLGMGYQFGDRLFMGVETEKDLDFPTPMFKTGVEYRLIDYIYARAGVRVQEVVLHSFGVGFKGWQFRGDLSFSYHPVLGYTPYFSLQYVFH